MIYSENEILSRAKIDEKNGLEQIFRFDIYQIV